FTMQRRWKLCAAQRAEMWSRWKAGQSLNAIGRALGKDKQVIHFLLARHGANEADQQAWESGLRPKVCRLALREKLRSLVASKLMQDWSPEQISGWLKQSYPDNKSLRVSHETIYRTLFLQARGALKQELVRHLRSQRRIRRSRHSSIHGHSQGRIVDAISIRERPAEVEERAIPGHWEGDLLRGTRNSHVATLVERHSRFVMLIKVPSRDTAEVVAALSQHVQQLRCFQHTRRSWIRRGGMRSRS